MAEDQPRDDLLVEEIKTSEFVLPTRHDLDDDLVVPTVMTPVDEGAGGAKQLVAATLRELEASEGDTGRQARLHLSVGLIIERRLGDVRRAIHHYMEAHRLAPSNIGAIRCARRLFRARQNWTMVLTLLDDELALTSSAEAAARLLYDKARVLEEWLANTDAAVAALEEALRRDPGNRRVLLRLRRIFQRRGDLEPLIDVCRQTAAATQDRRLRGLLFAEMARILQEDLEDEAGAIEIYAAAFAEDPASVTVSNALKQLYHTNGRWGDLVDLMMTEADLASTDNERAFACQSAARICGERLAQQERALELLGRAAELSPENPQVLQEMVDLLHEAGRHRELAQILRRRIECLVDEWERVTAHYRLGTVLEERLGEEEEALFHYRRAVAIDPTYVPALQALGKLCRRRGEWAELVAIGASEAESLQDPSARASRFCGLAELCETQLGDTQQAIELYRRALASVPHHQPSERELERLYREEGESEALIELWESQLDLLERSERGRVLERLGQLCEEKVGDPDRAVLYYRRALDHLPGDRWLLRTLERLLGRAKRWDQVLEVLDQEIEETEDARLAVALLHRTAEICETQLSDVDQAIARFRRVLERAPDFAPNLQSLGRIYFRQGKWKQVLELYQTEVARQDRQPSHKSSLLYKMGEIYQDHLSDEERAIDAYGEALEATPRFLPALHALARLYRARGDWEQLVEVLERQADVLSDPRRKAATLQAVGELHENQLEQLDQAVRYYQMAMDQAPGSEQAVEALLRLLTEQERWGEVVEVLEHAVSSAGDDATKLTLLKRLGEVWSERLLEPARAVRCFEQALALAEDDLETLEALSRLYRRTGGHEKLVDIFERLAVSSTDPEQAVAYLNEAAALTELHLPEKDVTSIYERIIQINDREVGALDALCRQYGERADIGNLARVHDILKDLVEDTDSKVALLLQLAGFREAAGDLEGAAWALGEATALCDDWVVVRELRRMRERLTQWPGVVETLEREATLGRDDQLAVDNLMMAAEIQLERFDDPERAAELLARVLERDPFHEEAATRLEQLLVQREAWNELVDVLRRRLDVIDAGARPGSRNPTQAQIELLARMAWIQREHLRHPLNAVGTLNRSLQIDPNHLPTLLTLGELHVALEQWQEAVDVYSRIVAVSSDTDVLRSAHFRLGEIWSEKLGDHRRAISSYQNVLALSAGDTKALQRLFDLFVRSRDWENAADTVGRLIEVETEPRRLVRHFFSLADIQEKGFGDPRMAAAQLQQAQAIDPTSEGILTRLTELLSHLGDWEALAGAIRSFLAAVPGDQESRGIAMRLQLGGLLRQRLMRNTEALEQYRAVVEIDPTNIEARLATATILVEEGRLDEAIIEHRETQALAPLNVDSLRQMRSIWTRMGENDMAYAVAAVLCCLGVAGEADETLYRERRGKGVRYPTVALDPSAFETIVVHPEEHALGRRILTVLGEAAHRIRPPRLADWRVGKADRLPIRSDDPLRVVVREVATALGIERDIEIYISPTRSREMELLLTDAPALVVGGGVMGTYSTMEVRFWIGQLLSYIRNRTWIGYGLSGTELGLLVRAACRVVDPAAMAGENEGKLADMARLVQRSISRRTRRLLEEVCLEYVAGPEPNYREWSLAMQQTALHTGLWVVNDLETALDHLKRMDPELAAFTMKGDPKPTLDAIRRHQLAVGLIQYWISEEFDSLRQASHCR
jgi:tetratricopeptide (TPR) repeat protein